MPDRLADGDPWAAIDDVANSLEPLLRLYEESGERRDALPPDYPKMPGEPPRVQPSKKVEAHWTEDGRRREPWSAQERSGAPDRGSATLDP